MSYTYESRHQINKNCCCFNMRKVSRAVTQFFDNYLEEVGIRSTQFTLLVEISCTSVRTLTEIAENLIMDRTTLTRNLKPLEKLGFIETVSTMDKRSKAYRLTQHGTEVLQRAIPIWNTAQENILSAIDDDSYKNLVNQMSVLLDVTSDAKAYNRKKRRK